MDEEQVTPGAEEVIDLEAHWNQLGAELPRVGDSEPTEDIGTRQPPPGRDVPETPAETVAPDKAPPAQAHAQEPPEESKTAPAEGDTLEAKVRQLESELAKREIDYDLAKKQQAKATRVLDALREAGQFEKARQAELRAEGRLTQEELDKGHLLQDAWVQKKEDEARAEEARAEQERQERERADASARAEAKYEFSRQALPLAREMIALGIDPNEKSNKNPEDPEETVAEQVLREALAHPDRQMDIALTWAVNDSDIQKQLTERLYRNSREDALMKLRAVSDAKGKVESAKAARGQFDRESSPGPSRGGDDPYNNMHPDDMWQYIEWKS